jgi:antitoxin ParD1/3/4
MATMNISLPDEMKEWAESKSVDGKYANVSDYMRDLIRRDIKRSEGVARFQAMIDEARASPSREITDINAYFEEIRERNQPKLKTNDAA